MQRHENLMVVRERERERELQFSEIKEGEKTFIKHIKKANIYCMK